MEVELRRQNPFNKKSNKPNNSAVAENWGGVAGEEGLCTGLVEEVRSLVRVASRCRAKKATRKGRTGIVVETPLGSKFIPLYDENLLRELQELCEAKERDRVVISASIPRGLYEAVAKVASKLYKVVPGDSLSYVVEATLKFWLAYHNSDFIEMS